MNKFTEEIENRIGAQLEIIATLQNDLLNYKSAETVQDISKSLEVNTHTLGNLLSLINRPALLGAAGAYIGGSLLSSQRNTSLDLEQPE